MLADLGGYAEAYAESNPRACLTELRLFAETIVNDIYIQSALPKPDYFNFNDCLRHRDFEELVPEKVRLKADAIRIHGNKAAHGQNVSNNTSRWILREAFDLSRWYAKTYLDIQDEQLNNEFIKPAPPDVESELKSSNKRESIVLRQHVSKLQTRRGKTQGTRPLIGFFAGPTQESERQPANVLSLEEGRRRGDQVADELGFDEATTRARLIDSQLSAAGWDIDNPEEVSRELKVHDQPTETGIGWIDYVLWDDNGKPLAVIEAKKALENPEKGQTQARLYADGLEKEVGQRPIIFYTNGFDIWIGDDKQG